MSDIIVALYVILFLCIGAAFVALGVMFAVGVVMSIWSHLSKYVKSR